MEKIILILAFIGVVSSASAAEVCRVPTAMADVSNALCTARALCTDLSLPVIGNTQAYTKGKDDGHMTAACSLAEMNTIKDLIAIGYKLQTNDTLVRY